MPTAHHVPAARAARIRNIRNRAAAATLATFALAWGVVAWDGSMGATSTTAQATPEASPATGEATAAAPATSGDDGATLSTGQS
jgi:hypothetical protein